MQDKASVQPAIGSFCQQMQRWLQKYPHLFDPVSCSAAFLSVAHVLSKAETLDITAQASPAIEALNAALLQKTMSQIHILQHWALSNILSALAQMSIMPDHLIPGCEEALMSRVVATEVSANAQSASNVLWAFSHLGCHPGNGDLICSCLDTIERGLKTNTGLGHGVECLGITMSTLAHMKLHIKPALAELIVTRVYQALLQGVSDPQTIARVLRACATLGYAPPHYMLRRFQESYVDSKQVLPGKLDRSVGWSLAILGALDMSFFTRITLRNMSGDPNNTMVDQLHRALQSLMPQDRRSPAYSTWKHVSLHHACVSCMTTVCHICLVKPYTLMWSSVIWFWCLSFALQRMARQWARREQHCIAVHTPMHNCSRKSQTYW